MALTLSSTSIPTSEKSLAIATMGIEKFLQRKEIGFWQIPDRQNLWAEADELGKELRSRFDSMVLVGIGGSALGPRVLVDLFQAPQASKKVFFCDNVDPWEFDRLFEQLPSIEKTCWVFISKSGSTIETLTSLDFISQKLGPGMPTNAFVISENRNNPLKNWATKNSVRSLEIPVDVGGRFSVLTSVGLLPASFLGVDLQQLREGAKAAVQNRALVAQTMAQSLQSFDRGEWISQFWFYSSGLKNFGAWLQQLWAESLAKSKTRAGSSAPRVSTPLYQVGACDQHSVLQQVMEGAKDKWLVFTRIDSLEKGGEKLQKSQFTEYDFMKGKTLGLLLGAEAAATEQALNQYGVSTMRLTMNDLSPRSLGELFMFWQLVVAGLGECFDINAFDQPGVEVGKQLAKESLKA